MLRNHSSRDLLDWYHGKVNPFFREHLSEQKIEEFEKDFTRLNHSVESSEIELAVCFLGNSGVGKSTLINAVIGGTARSSAGGVGPLTAQALVDRHSSHPRFEAEYHGPGQLLRTVFGLEQMPAICHADSFGERGFASWSSVASQALQNRQAAAHARVGKIAAAPAFGSPIDFAADRRGMLRHGALSLQLGGKVNFSVYPGRFNSKRSVVRQ
jgi:hypothetical protein